MTRKRYPVIGDDFTADCFDPVATVNQLIDTLRWYGPFRFALNIRQLQAAIADIHADSADDIEAAVNSACEALSQWAQSVMRCDYYEYGCFDDAETFGFYVRAQAAINDAVAVAREFGHLMQAELSPAEFRQMIDRNKAEMSPGVCHSHDFCDANMIMFEACKKIKGDEFFPNTDENAALWNEAWEIAIEADFYK